MRGFVNGAMIVVGALLLCLFGLCTAYVWIAGGWDLFRNGGHGEVAAYDRAFLKASLLVGLLPTLLGGFLLWAGLRRRPGLRPRPSARPPG
jgi:uncharacterized membrane protein YphA (DoxX/SURF4 family)